MTTGLGSYVGRTTRASLLAAATPLRLVTLDPPSAPAFHGLALSTALAWLPGSRCSPTCGHTSVAVPWRTCALFPRHTTTAPLPNKRAGEAQGAPILR